MSAKVLVQHALELAQLGLRVFPLWWPRDEGCACRAGRACRQPGKHPRIQGWQQEATSDAARIRSWWAQWPMANIGVATGTISGHPTGGILVLDIDAGSGGHESLAALEAAHGELPETVEVLTGRCSLEGIRGRHLYFAHPGVPLGNSVQRLGPGLDLRCEGGLVVGPGSLHASGTTYEWEVAHHPDDTPLAEVPRWVLDHVLLAPRRGQVSALEPDAPWIEPEGLPPIELRIASAQSWLAERAPAIQGCGGSSRTMGLCAVVTRGFALAEDEHALEALADWNARCNPPWDVRPEAPAADSLLRKIREGRSKGHVIAIGDKLLTPRRAFFGSHGLGQANATPSDVLEEMVPVLAITGELGELPRLVHQTERALSGVQIYAFGGNLVRVIENDTGPHLLLVSKDYLRVLVNQVVGFARRQGKDFRPCWPPDEVLGALLTKGHYELPEITGIVETPTLRPDGTILDTPGFDPPTGVMFLSGTAIWRAVPERPGPEQLEEALAWLHEPFVDFPFHQPHHRAAAIAALVTAVIRPAIAGPVPMFLFDATTPGTGKGLLANVVSIVATGRRVPVLSPVDDDDEMRKLLTSLALEGPRMIIFDNVVRSLGGAALDAALTSTTWRGRLLGQNRTFHGPLRPFWGATGNNIQVKGDLLRRVVPIRMFAKVENPETRQDFVHPDLLSWVREHRVELVHAVLTLARAYLAEGAPRPATMPRLGGFEEWDDLVRAPLVWAGLSDVLEGKQELQRQDSEVQAFEAVLACWFEVFGNEPRTMQAVKRATEGEQEGRLGTLREALIELAPTKDAKDWDSLRLRYCFRKYHGRVFGGLCLASGERASSGTKWRVEAIAPARV